MPLAAVFGTGPLSSSGGQPFPVRGKTTTGREMTIYGGQVLSTYTHVSDQHTTYGTKIIVATKREAHYVLDEILGNATDLPITEHATDTRGVTLVNFGLFDLLGLQLSPRIRDLGKITLHRVAAKARAEANYPHVGPLLTRRVNVELIPEHWDDLLRLAGSVKFGHATASLIVGTPLGVKPRQNALAAALKEYGALRRTIYAARFLSDPPTGARSRGSSTRASHCTRSSVTCSTPTRAPSGPRHLEAQTEQAGCLTLVTNAVIAWITEYCGLAAESMRRCGRHVDDDVLAHISPAHSENINFFAPSRSTSTPNSPSLARPATGHCARPTPCSDRAVLTGRPDGDIAWCQPAASWTRTRGSGAMMERCPGLRNSRRAAAVVLGA
jgi:TnpA family transposase